MVVLVCLNLPLFAQNEKQIFLNGKQSLEEGRYNFAMESFKNLTSPDSKHGYKEYASFYYGLAAYKSGNLGLARSMWLQIESKYPKWKNMPEAYYWLAEVYFQEGEPALATDYAIKSKSKNTDGLISNYLSKVDDVAVLKRIQKKHSKNKAIANMVVQAIMKQPMAERDFGLVRKLSEQFEFQMASFGLPDIDRSEKKKAYSVAVMLPFMFETLDNTSRVEKNKFVLDIYNGIVQAANELNGDEQKIRVFPYDTKKSRKETAKILDKPEMKEMDLIIGPLYPDPSKLTSDFCFANKINMINPVSSTSAIINNNPYSFLLKPTDEVQAVKAAEYALDSFQVNKNVYIFFDTKKDSVMADVYAQRLKKEGYEVLLKAHVDEEKITKVYEKLTETYEAVLTEEEADSIRKIPGRIVKESKPRSNEEMYLYEERYMVEWDSIGHVYMASSDPLHASMLISATEIRGDQIPIIGRGNWLKGDMVTIEQVERLGVSFVSADYVDPKKGSFEAFRDNYHKQYKTTPSLNSMLGYELMMYTGEMMLQYGNHFQVGTLERGRIPGRLFVGLDYGLSNCNTVVPITRFINSELQIVNNTDDAKN
jgi:tetratricopeptide (TPR) repeat protein